MMRSDKIRNMKLKGIKYTRSVVEIKEYMKMPVESKLAWLESFNEFIYNVSTPKILKIREKFLRGEI